MKRFGLILVLVVLTGAGCQRSSVSHDAFPQPHVGSVGVFQYYPRWNVSGRVTVLNDRTLRLNNFTFHGDKLTAQLMLLKDKKNLGILKDLTNAQMEAASFDVQLPEDVQVEDFNLVVVYSPDIGAPVSGAKFSE